MLVDRRILACVVLSVGAHVAFARAMRGLPKRADAPATRVVSIRVVSPPAPEPPPEPPHAEPAPKPVPAERARPQRVAPRVAAQDAPKDVPPPEHPPAPSDTAGTPVFGVSMESTSTAGGGPAMPVGSPGGPREGHGGGAPAAKGKGDDTTPVPAYEVTTQPLPQGNCGIPMPEEARRAGMEGLVVLEIVVGADGRVRAARVTKSAGHILDEAALAAIRACRFSPGRRGDDVVPVSGLEFKYRFLQADE